MKNLKIFLWVLFLFIVQTVVINYARIQGTVPDIVFAFIIAFSILEGDFVCVVTVSIICGVFSGSLGGGSFAFEVLLYTYSVIIILKFRDKYMSFPRVLKVVIAAFVFNTAGAAVLYFANNLSMSVSALTRVFLPYGLYNMLIAAALYLILKYTMYRKEGRTEKQLI